MEAVNMKPEVCIYGKELASLVRATLKQQFPGKKFSVTTCRSTGSVYVKSAVSGDTTIYEEDVREALHEFTATYINPNADLDEVMNGGGGVRKVSYPKIEDDGSISYYRYGDLFINIFNNRAIEIAMLNQMMKEVN